MEKFPSSTRRGGTSPPIPSSWNMLRLSPPTAPTPTTGLGGLWLAFIGWFLHTAASQSYQQERIQEMLEEVSVTDLMRRNPTQVSATTTVDSLIKDHMLGSDESAFAVVENGRLVGLIR